MAGATEMNPQISVKELTIKGMTLRLTFRQSCPSCQSENRKALFDLPLFRLFQCRCGLRYIDPSLDGESMSRIYESSEVLSQINPALEQYYEYDPFRPGSRTWKDYTRALNELERLALGRELLEVGCGSGEFLAWARKNGWSVTGNDSSVKNVEELRAKGIEGDSRSFFDYVPAKSFDVVAMLDLIEHPQDPGAFLKKSFEILKPDGLLLLATPHDPHFLSYLAAFFYRISVGKIKTPVERFYILEHTSYFSTQTLSHLVATHGFKILKTWKTETDLERYCFSPLVKFGLQGAFLLARWWGLQNRLLLIARKPA